MLAKAIVAVSCVLLLAPVLPAAAPPATQPAGVPVDLISGILGKGALAEEVYTIVKPRADLLVSQLDMGDIPPAAGLASTFHFFPCPCGKTNVVGQFCAIDYEVNTIVDELRKADIQVIAIAPMFTGERPRIMLVRFMGRAEAEPLAKALKNALRWTSEKPGKTKWNVRGGSVSARPGP